MKLAYLKIFEDPDSMAGTIAACEGDDVYLTVFHSADQGMAAIERCGLPAAEAAASREIVTTATYDPRSTNPLFILSPLAAKWLLGILNEVREEETSFTGTAGERIEAFVVFKSEDPKKIESCALACTRTGRYVSLYIVYSIRQAAYVLQQHPSAAERQRQDVQTALHAIQNTLPEISSTPMQHLYGAGAALVYTAISQERSHQRQFFG